MAGRARGRPSPHPAAHRRRQRVACDHLRQPVSRRRGVRRPARSWRRTGRARRAATPHRAGLLPRLHGHPTRRRRTGAALPPFRADQIEEYASRQAAILRNAGARVLLTFAEAERAAALLCPLAPSLTTVATVRGSRSTTRSDADSGVGRRTIPEHYEDALALIRYTPRGARARRRASRCRRQPAGQRPRLRGGLRAERRRRRRHRLPLYHDMG